MSRQQDKLKAGIEVTIVGGGIVGICCALSLVKRGLRVHLVERDTTGQGASYGNAGVISPWSIVPQSPVGLWRHLPAMLLRSDGPVSIRPGYAARFAPWALKFIRHGTATRGAAISDAMAVLNQPSIALYRKHLARTGHEDLIKESYYVHAYRDAQRASLDAPGYKIRRDKGADLERIGSDALQQLEPALSHDFQAAILIKGQARAMAPGKIGQVLAAQAQAAGVRFTKAHVQSITPNAEGGWSIVTEREILRSPKLVIAAGAWSAHLLRPLGIKIPLEAERGYHIQFAAPGVKLTHSVMDTDGMFVASSMLDGLRVAGTTEFAGLDAPINAKRVASLARRAKAMLPNLTVDPMQTWSGIRPSLPDNLPIISAFNNHEGLFGAFGHAHHGLMMAPKTGEIVADLVVGNPKGSNLSAFDAQRFQ